MKTQKYSATESFREFRICKGKQTKNGKDHVLTFQLHNHFDPNDINIIRLWKTKVNSVVYVFCRT